MEKPTTPEVLNAAPMSVARRSKRCALVTCSSTHVPQEAGAGASGAASAAGVEGETTSPTMKSCRGRHGQRGERAAARRGGA